MRDDGGQLAILVLVVSVLGVWLVYMQHAEESVLGCERDEHSIDIARERSHDEPCEGIG